MSFEVWKYDGNKVKEKLAFAGGKDGLLKTATANWKYRIASLRNTGDGALQLEIDFSVEKGEEKNAAVAISFGFADWSVDNYVLIPGAVYNGNRFPVIKGGYMPPYPPEMYFNSALPLTFSDNPRLALKHNEPSKIELLTWSTATPAMSFYSKQQQRGFVVLTEPNTKSGTTGLIIEENADRSRATFSLTAPGIREYVAGFGDFSKSQDKPQDWKSGETIRMRCYIYSFPAKSIPAFLETWMDKRKALLGEMPQYYVAPMNAVSDYTRQQVEKNRFHNSSFASIYFPENSFTRFQLGWIGGMMNTYPMLSLNDSLHITRVSNTIDFVINHMQGKSGYFYGIIDDGKTLAGERELPPSLKVAHPHIVSSAMVRKNADALFWLCKQLMLFKALNQANKIDPAWETAARNLSAAFARTWKQHGDLGQYVDPESGEVLVFNSTAASVAPAGLALAAQYFHEPSWLDCAKAVAESYYHRFTATLGLTGGNCGDISQDADSESTFGLLESFMALYWATGDAQWLSKAKVQAALGSTWTLSYNYEFPQGSDLASFNAHSAGGVWASTQNKHAAPGICTSSGDYLFKLFRATGETKYAQLLRDIINGHTEQVELPGRPTVSAGLNPHDSTRGTKWGSSMERIQTSDAEGYGVIGKLYNGSNGWTELNGMLMAMEVPGIYIQTDQDKIFVFDQVIAGIKKNKQGARVLTIKNPTPYTAEISYFTETAAQAKKPLGYMEFLKWRKVKVVAGKTVDVKLN
ncbi:hypothetical protein FPE01S_01_17500 [Flavihumibacter petaseus NBRC 106054]|uniref:Uncharacterized protein n=1 Tax=Flavihumibacter petaseus NBRC 106054 TaxID=1220578 RepID=A0A0E9MYC1_9BACT|nr:hypothetical protein FPE01S_01_17500 [Flavihumibacter petaseus NBRC 106054]